MSVASSVAEKLERLREIDNVIDIGRASVQLRILLALGANRDGMDTYELADVVGQRRKAILDALRKLESKGLVVKRGDLYTLSEEGFKLYEDLMYVLGGSNGSAQERSAVAEVQRKAQEKVNGIDVAREITRNVYLFDVLLALGMSRDHVLPLKDLAAVVGISPQRLQDYLESHGNGLVKKVFRRRFGRRPEVCYKLTDEGLKAFYRLPHYAKLKRNKAFLILQRIVKTGHPRRALKRVCTILAVGSALSILVGVALGWPYIILVLSGWLLFACLLALLVELAY